MNHYAIAGVVVLNMRMLIKRHISEFNTTQTVLAEEMRINPSILSRYLRGGEVQTDTMLKIITWFAINNKVNPNVY